MAHDLYPGLTGDVRIYAIRRGILERDVQNLVGPITGIRDLSTATLYGIRDHARRSFIEPPLNADEVRRVLNEDWE